MTVKTDQTAQMLISRYYKFVLAQLNGTGHAKMCLMPYVNNKGADQPAHPRSLISTFIVHHLDSIICILAIYKVSIFQLGSVDDQTGLNLTWSKIPEDTFSRDVARILTLFDRKTTPSFLSTMRFLLVLKA